jgi:hypothetical protein
MKHWTSRVVDDKWLFICCPTMEDEERMKDFKTRLQIFREFKAFHKQIEDDPNLIGWIAKTWVGNMEVMKLLYRLGADTYKEQHNVYWFKKLLKGEDKRKWR